MGNLCEQGGDPFQASEPTGTVTCAVEDLSNGHYTISWEAKKTGTFHLEIGIAGSMVYGSPTEVTMLPAAPEAEQGLAR